MKKNLIPADEICIHHHIELNFIRSLEDFGLISTVVKEKSIFLTLDEILKLEKFVRLTQDLDINLEGLHAVSHLLRQMEIMQLEIANLKKEISHYKHFN
ncbi:chaperone modulator CbpM [Pedobacter sandarakinus]|uniref:chaperone modulator CbpM n=1 Tax=Pedobacter sandarakinus TaxID=353156 RepID=UPI002245F369|nr:chaperone modulator CbpM [Pedobacter sandarakinus]MCX2573137.1 hypothetical protein [Pedobacter sandarakinus]